MAWVFSGDKPKSPAVTQAVRVLWPLAVAQAVTRGLLCSLASGEGPCSILTLTDSSPSHWAESSESGFTSEAKVSCVSIVLPAGVLSTCPQEVPSCLTATLGLTATLPSYR